MWKVSVSIKVLRNCPDQNGLCPRLQGFWLLADGEIQFTVDSATHRQVVLGGLGKLTEHEPEGLSQWASSSHMVPSPAPAFLPILNKPFPPQVAPDYCIYHSIKEQTTIIPPLNNIKEPS